MNTQRSLPWKSLQALARVLTTVMFDLNVDGKENIPARGVALIVRRAGVPVIPAMIVGSFDAWPIHRPVWRCAPIRVMYGPPMDLTELDDELIVATIDRTLREMFERVRCDLPCRRLNGPTH